MLRALRPTPPVIFLLNSLGVGGSEAKTVRMANALSERGTQVCIAYLNPPEQLKADIAPEVQTVHLRRRGKFSIPALRALLRLLGTFNSPTLVTVNLYPALYGALARTFMGASRFRLLMAMNTTEFPRRSLERRMPLYRRILARADTIVFGAQAQRKLWRDRHGVAREGSRGPDSIVLYNGVDTALFGARPPMPCDARAQLQTRYVIGCVGRMRPEKAHVDLVRTTAALRARGIDVGLLLVGDGPERGHILEEIERLRLGSAVVLGGETRDVRPFLAAMDLFVLPSVETFSNAALEALASGVPVICTRGGGMDELIGFGGGLSCEAGDVESFATAIARLLTDEVERRRLAMAARRAAVEHFDWDRTVDRFIALTSAR